MDFEDKYLDVLQNIEHAIVSTYDDNPGLTDSSVMLSIESIIDTYRAENIGRDPRNFMLSDIEQVLFGKIKEVCEWRLGRAKMNMVYENADTPEPEPKSVDEIILCLKRIAKSAKKWNKRGGSQGYLNFVSQFF